MKSFDPSSHLHAARWVLEGNDAKDFLHRITTVDLKNLKAGQGAKGALLTPQGKYESRFHLIQISDSRFIFEVEGPKDAAEKLAKLIERYTFAEKIQGSTLSDSKTLWIFPKDLTGPFNGLSLFQAKTLDPSEPDSTLFYRENLKNGLHWMSVSARKETLEMWLKANQTETQALTPAEWEKERIENLVPEVGREITEESSPLEVGDQTAIAANKGCFPGQEVIEKTIALGSPAKKLVQLKQTGGKFSPGKVPVPLLETKTGQSAGLLTSHDGKGALAVIKKIYAKVGMNLQTESQNEFQIQHVVETQK